MSAYRQGPTVKYALAGASQRHAMERAMAMGNRLGSRDLKVLAAVFAVTTTYSRMWARRTLAELAAFVYQCTPDDVSRSQRHRVGLSLRKLNEAEVLVYEGGKGRYAQCRVEVPAMLEVLQGAPPEPEHQAVEKSPADAPRRAFNATTPRGSTPPPPATPSISIREEVLRCVACDGNGLVYIPSRDGLSAGWGVPCPECAARAATGGGGS